MTPVQVFFTPVNPSYSEHVRTLFYLLHERAPEQSISHSRMPTFLEHKAFVENHPYYRWYLLQNALGNYLGSIYLTKRRELGVFIFREYQRRGIAITAVLDLMQAHPGKFLANVNPANEASIKFWEKLGFKHIQNTYVRH